MLALCCYCLDECAATDVLDILPPHGLAIARRDGQWKLIEPAVRKRSESLLRQSKAELQESESRYRTLLEYIPQWGFSDVTERKRAEEELAFKSALLEAQSEASPDGILFVDNQQRPIPLNKRFGEMWNVPPHIQACRYRGPLLEHNAAQVRNPAAFIEKIEHLDEHKEESSYDQLELKDGRFFDLYSSPLAGSKGDNFGRIWYFRDVTDGKKADQALREAEERFRTVIETSPDAILLVDLEGRVLVANREAARFGGFGSVEELLAKKTNIFDVLAPEEHFRTRQNLQLLIEKGVLRDVEHTAVSKDGVRRPIEVSSSLYRDPQGRPKGFIAMFRDTTQRKGAEEALRKSESKFRGIAERSLDAIFITDLNGVVTYMSPTVENILQYKPEEMIGRQFAVFLAEDEAPQISQAMLRHLKRRRGELFETTAMKKDGSRAVIEINAGYVVEHKKIVGSQGIVRDVTERKQVQKSLEARRRRPRPPTAPRASSWPT